MKIVLIGDGKMGSIFKKLYKDEVVYNAKNLLNFNVSDYDVILDFSNKSNLSDLLRISTLSKKPLVIGTTGFDEEDKKRIEEASKSIPILVDSNFSIAISLLKKILKTFNEKLLNYDFFINEIHHENKKDTPSGTALDLNSFLSNKGNIHSIRAKNIVGIHQILILGENDKISITHEAYNKEIFCYGAHKAIEFLVDKDCGLYSFFDVVDDNY